MNIFQDLKKTTQYLSRFYGFLDLRAACYEGICKYLAALLTIKLDFRTVFPHLLDFVSGFALPTCVNADAF